MYYIYFNDNKNCLYVTNISQSNQIPIYNTPFLMEIIKAIPKFETSFKLKRNSTDLSKIQEFLYNNASHDLDIISVKDKDVPFSTETEFDLEFL